MRRDLPNRSARSERIDSPRILPRILPSCSFFQGLQNRLNFFGRGWLRGLDLNQRPLGYEPNELPDCSTPH